MNIEENTMCFYNHILIVVPLYVYVSNFSQIVLISHSHLFSFVFQEKNIYYFCSQLLIVFFHYRKNKEEDNSLLSHLIMKY